MSDMKLHRGWHTVWIVTTWLTHHLGGLSTFAAKRMFK